jgi:heat shock protein HspQ
MSDEGQAKFDVGQVIHHKKFGYRGVIVDVDPEFRGTEEWYQVMARSQPPRDKPWYHVLVHDAGHRTYVAERHLEPDASGEQVNHPELGVYFDTFRGDRYERKGASN